MICLYFHKTGGGEYHFEFTRREATRAGCPRLKLDEVKKVRVIIEEVE